MKAKNLLKSFICFILLCSSSLAFAQSWNWGRAGYGAGLKPQCYCTSVASDMSGNAYITGYYSSQVSFGSDTLSNNGTNSAFLAKYAPNGNLIWATQALSDSVYSTGYGYSVATDASGNSIVTGSFTGIITFGNYQLSSVYDYNAFFLVKYDPSGNVLWAKQSVTSIGNYYIQTYGYSVTTDKNNNIYVAGSFSDTIWVGNYELTTAGQSAPFLVKYDANGNVLWAKTANTRSAKSSSSAISVTADSKGNAYLTGSFTGDFLFNSHSLVSLNVPSAFLVKYSGSGNVVWAKQSDNITLVTSEASATSVITDIVNNVYITGSFYDSVKFGSQILYSPNYYYNSYGSAFLTKYDTNGNVIWAKQSSLGMSGNSLTADPSSYAIYLGTTNNLVDTTFSFSKFSLHIAPWADNSSFLWKFDTAGIAICGSALENAGYNNTTSICCTSASGLVYLYMAGNFINTDSVTCGPDILFSYNGGYSNIFVARWNNCAADAGINDVKGESEQVKVYPNPSNGEFTIVESGKLNMENEKSNIEVYNMLGEKVYSQFSTLNSPFSINLSDEPNGVYLYRVINESGSLIGNGKLVIEK